MKKIAVSILFAFLTFGILGCTNVDKNTPSVEKISEKAIKKSVDNTNSCGLILPGKIHFSNNSILVLEQYQIKLDAFAKSYINSGSICTILITGYSDADGDEMNKDIALKRAKAVEKVLESSGMRQENMIVRASEKPVKIEKVKNCSTCLSNRRVELQIVE